MDLFALKSLLLLLCVCGRSAADILPEGPLDALEGGTATFNTLLKNPEFTVIVWNFNDGTELKPIATLTSTLLNVPDDYTGRSDIDANGTLTLKALTGKDSGEYSMSIIDKLGNTRAAEIELRVMVPVSDVVITPNVPEARELFTKVALTCSAKGSFLRYKWLNGTTPITADSSRVTIERNDPASTSTLSFASVYRTDLVGPLFCNAYNTLSSATSQPFNLTVHYGPEQVTLSPATLPPYLASGSDFNLTCTAQSDPPATFSWFKNGLPLEIAGPLLTLKDIEAKNADETKASYTCMATNAKTETNVNSTTVTFGVLEKIVDVRLSGPEGKLFAGNSSANLSCEAAKGSMQTVKWLKNGAPLSSGGRVVIATDGKSVLIEPLQKEDNGEFTCEISNPVNKDSAKVKLTVYYGPEPLLLLGDTEVEVTDPVSLECTASSMPPAEISWKFNGTKTKVVGNTYVIEKAVYADTGKYTCEAYNSVTGKTVTKDHLLSVKEEGALDEGLSDGAIAGIVIGVLAAVALAIGLFMYCRQKVPMESPY